MDFKATFRNHPDFGSLRPYYRLVESYWNIDNRICHKTILNVGFITDLKSEQLNIIQKKLTQLASGIKDLFEIENPSLQPYIDDFRNQILANKTIDIVTKSNVTNLKTWVDLESIKRTQVRDPKALHEQAKQIIRIASSQKVVYTTDKNKIEELLEIKK